MKLKKNRPQFGIGLVIGFYICNYPKSLMAEFYGIFTILFNVKTAYRESGWDGWRIGGRVELKVWEVTKNSG